MIEAPQMIDNPNDKQPKAAAAAAEVSEDYLHLEFPPQGRDREPSWMKNP